MGKLWEGWREESAAGMFDMSVCLKVRSGRRLPSNLWNNSQPFSHPCGTISAFCSELRRKALCVKGAHKFIHVMHTAPSHPLRNSIKYSWCRKPAFLMLKSQNRSCRCDPALSHRLKERRFVFVCKLCCRFTSCKSQIQQTKPMTASQGKGRFNTWRSLIDPGASEDRVALVLFLWKVWGKLKSSTVSSLWGPSGSVLGPLLFDLFLLGSFGRKQEWEMLSLHCRWLRSQCFSERIVCAP